jgi:glycosyltransferase involved in cell wall biosynthesis
MICPRPPTQSMSREQKATFVIKSMAPCGGGAERVLSHVLSELVQQNWQITLVTFDDARAKSFYPLPDEVQWKRLGSGPFRNRAGSILWRAAKLRRYLNSERPRRVVAFMSSSSVPAALALRGNDADFIVSEHIVLSYYNGRRLERRLLGWAFHRARAVTMITPHMLSDFAAYWPEPNYQLIPNPVPSCTKQSDLNFGASSSYKILAAGTLEKRKNFTILIRAFAKLAPSHPNWSVEIWGQGPLQQELEALIGDLGLQERIILPGSTPTLLEKMRQAHIFAMPSILESFGMVSLEAMSVGLPVIGLSQCPGTNEVVQHGRTGLLVDGDDLVDGFAEGLQRLMNSPAQRETFGRAGLEHARMYDQGHVGNLWHELLLKSASGSSS